MYIIVRDTKDYTLTLDKSGSWQFNPRKKKEFYTKEQAKKWLKGHYTEPKDTYRIVDITT